MCTPCGVAVPGQYQDQRGKHTCKDCPAGKHAKTVSAAALMINSFVGQVACDACAAGRFSDAGGQPACKACAPGQFQPSSSPKGRFQTACTACRSCPSGRVLNGCGGALSGSCQACPAGTRKTLRRESASWQCKACRPGQHQDSVGADECKACPAGRYQADTGQATCVQCAAGHAQISPGQTTCDPCVRRIGFQPQRGAAQCHSCAGSVKSLTCADGTWLDGCGGPARGHCRACLSASATISFCSDFLAPPVAPMPNVL